MKYTYTLFTLTDDSKEPVRKAITTRFEEVPESACIFPNHVEVYDNLNNKVVTNLQSEDDWLGWHEALARAVTWADKQDRIPAPATIVEELSKADDVNAGASNLADNNLKTRTAVGKPVMSPVPPVALLALGAAMQDGAAKYGIFNWRETAVTSTVFYDAMMRHLIAWYSGENFAPDSKVHHLAHLMAGCAIILDAELHGVLNDDRDKNSHKVTPAEMGLIKEG